MENTLEEPLRKCVHQCSVVAMEFVSNCLSSSAKRNPAVLYYMVYTVYSRVSLEEHTV